MTKTFKSQAEAIEVLAPLHAAGKAVTAFGRTTVNVWMGAGWLKLTNDRFNALVST